jgi:hypothetical protein
MKPGNDLGRAGLSLFAGCVSYLSLPSFGAGRPACVSVVRLVVRNPYLRSWMARRGQLRRSVPDPQQTVMAAQASSSSEW